MSVQLVQFIVGFVVGVAIAVGIVTLCSVAVAIWRKLL